MALGIVTRCLASGGRGAGRYAYIPGSSFLAACMRKVRGKSVVLGIVCTVSSEWWEDAGHFACIPRGSFLAVCMRKTHGNNMRFFEQNTFMVPHRDHTGRMRGYDSA